MTNQQHPITPPPELVQQWVDNWYSAKVKHDELIAFIATQSARWGADMELEACVEWLRGNGLFKTRIGHLRAARRPKLPSLKEQALEAFQFISKCHPITGPDWDTIRRALEQLND